MSGRAERPQARGGDDRVLTWPNLISFVRLLGVPLFLFLFLVARADVAAIVVLAVGGTSDWVDGWIARRLGQVSRLGELLDPLADRLYILATLIAFTAREVVPWQFTAALLARELLLLGSLGVLRRHGYGPRRCTTSARRPPSCCWPPFRFCCWRRGSGGRGGRWRDRLGAGVVGSGALLDRRCAVRDPGQAVGAGGTRSAGNGGMSARRRADHQLSALLSHGGGPS